MQIHPVVVPAVLATASVLLALSACSRDFGEEPARPRSICVAPARSATAAIVLGAAAPFGDRTFAQPVEIVSGPGGRFYVLEQAGVVRVVPADGSGSTTALDLSDQVESGGEAGLLGIAFDPRFAENGFVYLSFNQAIDVRKDAVFQSVIARYESKDGGATLDRTTEKRLLVVDQPFANHDGGKLAFGPDGFLYIGFGDGGSGGDPKGNAQNRDVLLGKILRIDPHGGDPYASPPSNPFAGGGGRPEIYAYGMRNPWKFSFDSATGDLWCGDVGQDRYEEVDQIVLGGNYGWNVREGRHCYPPGKQCTADGFVEPLAEYGRSEGATVTAGYVYRGEKIPALAGKFLYADFASGTVWALERDAAGQALTSKLAEGTGLTISTFAEGPDRELWVADYASGHVRAILPGVAAAPGGPAATTLAETGCVDPAAPTTAPGGAIPYDVASPLWSDGAVKSRWLFVPEGKKISVRDDGDFDVPPGSVAVKTFRIDGRLVETRLFARYEDGTFAGYSYEWNDDESAAILLTEGKDKLLPGGRTWTFPSRAECLSCHTSAAGFTLGIEARQVDLGRFASVLDRPVAREQFPPLASLDAPSATAEERARSYLHANCSMCHREGGGAGAATMDLRIGLSLAATRTCGVEPSAGNLGVLGAQILFPGDPTRSILALRMRRRGDGQMPPLATHLVDEAGVGAIEAYIGSLGACP